MATTFKTSARQQQPLSKPKPDNHRQNPRRISTTEKISEYYLYTLDRVTQPTIGNILKAQNQIATILTYYPCDATE